MWLKIRVKKSLFPVLGLLSILFLNSCSSTKTPKQAVQAKALTSQTAKKLPRENIIDVPAMSDGLSVSNLFQSHMVLQRDKPIVIWGWAKPGEKITATFAGETKSVKASADRSWKLSFESQPANAHGQKMIIKTSKESLVFRDILIGDVWVLGGQSNMEFPISRVEGGALEIASANYPQVRLMTVPYGEGPEEKKSFPRLMEWSGWHRQHFKKGYWEICTPQSVYEFSAIGYIFGRRIHKALKVPIGLVDISRGGTTVEAWTPDAVLRKINNEQVKEKLADWDQRVAEWDGKKDLEDRIARHQAWLKRMKKEGKKEGLLA